MLNDVGATLLGAVLTMMPTRGSGAYSYNYYYSGGSYGDDETRSAASVTPLGVEVEESTTMSQSVGSSEPGGTRTKASGDSAERL